MAANEHKYLLDINRHNPLGFEGAPNNSYLGKLNGVSYSDMQGSLSWSYQLETFTLRGNTPTTTVVVAAGIDFIRMPYDLVISDFALANDSKITFDVTAAAGAPATGIKIDLIGYRTT